MPVGKGGAAKLTPVDALPTITRDAQASMSAPIMDGFMESGNRFAKVEREADVKAQSTKASLARYAKTRELPIKVSVREGEVYLERTDLASATAEG